MPRPIARGFPRVRYKPRALLRLTFSNAMIRTGTLALCALALSSSAVCVLPTYQSPEMTPWPKPRSATNGTATLRFASVALTMSALTSAARPSACAIVSASGNDFHTE